MRNFASRIGVQFFLFRSKYSKFNETRLWDTFLLVGMKINDDDNCNLFCKSAFSDVFEGVMSKQFYSDLLIKDFLAQTF